MRKLNNRKSCDEFPVGTSSESRKIINAYKNSQNWSDYLRSELKVLSKTLENTKWPTQMLEHLNVIERSARAIEYQSKFYYEEFAQLHESDGHCQVPKVLKISKVKNSMDSTMEPSTQDSQKNVVEYFAPPAKSWSLELTKTANLDDTGYSALQLQNDEFLHKLVMIKEQMRRTNHPLTQFIIWFDQELMEEYSKLTDREAQNYIYHVLHLLIVSIIKFYNLDLMGQEMWKDLLLNALTNMVLKNNVYLVYYNLIMKSVKWELETISNNVKALANISPRQLGIPDILGKRLVTFSNFFPRLSWPKLRWALMSIL